MTSKKLSFYQFKMLLRDMGKLNYLQDAVKKLDDADKSAFFDRVRRQGAFGRDEPLTQAIIAAMPIEPAAFAKGWDNFADGRGLLAPKQIRSKRRA